MSDDPNPLPQSRRALEQACRVLDELNDHRDVVRSYQDHMPFALDRLLKHVLRTDGRSFFGVEPLTESGRASPPTRPDSAPDASV
jgi:hypothetical protein